MIRASAIFIAGLGGWACSGSDVRVEVAFPDELSGAPARIIDLADVGDRSCRDVSRDAFDDAVTHARDRTEIALPVPEDFDPFGVLEAGRATTLAVAARDRDGLVVARGCERIDGDDSVLRVTLTLRPRCDDAPAGLDLAVAFDGSAAMREADIALEGDVRSALEDEIFGEAGAGDTLRVWVDAGTIEPSSLGQTELNGPVRIVDTLVAATRALRNDARCAAEPVVLAIAAGDDVGSDFAPVDVQLGLEGAEGDLDDDIFAFGIGLQTGGVEILREALPATFSRVVGPLLTRGVLRFQLGEARAAFTARATR